MHDRHVQSPTLEVGKICQIEQVRAIPRDFGDRYLNPQMSVSFNTTAVN